MLESLMTSTGTSVDANTSQHGERLKSSNPVTR